MAKTKDPKRWTESHATQVLDEADRSGLTDRAYGARRGINPQRLSLWRRRLGRKRGRGGQAGFVEVRARQSAAMGGVEVRLTNGRVVKVPTTVDVKVLGELLDAIEGRAC